MSSLFVRHLAARGLPVTAIDADINQHLAEALGADREPPAMGAHLSPIKEYLRGSNPWISSAAARHGRLLNGARQQPEDHQVVELVPQIPVNAFAVIAASIAATQPARAPRSERAAGRRRCVGVRPFGKDIMIMDPVMADHDEAVNKLGLPQ